MHDKEHHCCGKCYINRLWERLNGLSPVTIHWLVLLRLAKDWRSLAWIRWIPWDSTGINNVKLLNMPQLCHGCGKWMTVDHALSCKWGRLVYIRHNNMGKECKFLSVCAFSRGVVSHNPIFMVRIDTLVEMQMPERRIPQPTHWSTTQHHSSHIRNYSHRISHNSSINRWRSSQLLTLMRSVKM